MSEDALLEESYLELTCIVESKSNFIENEIDLTIKKSDYYDSEIEWTKECYSKVMVPYHLPVRQLEKYILNKLHYNLNNIEECKCYIEIPNWRQLRLESACKSSEQTIFETFKNISNSLILKLKILRCRRDLIDEMRMKMLLKILEALNAYNPNIISRLNVPLEMCQIDNILKQQSYDKKKDITKYTEAFNNWYQESIKIEPNEKPWDASDRPKSVPIYNNQRSYSKYRQSCGQSQKDQLSKKSFVICDSTAKFNLYEEVAHRISNSADNYFSGDDSDVSQQIVSRSNSIGSCNVSNDEALTNNTDKAQPTDLRVHRGDVHLNGDQNIFVPFLVKNESTGIDSNPEAETYEIKMRDTWPYGADETVVGCSSLAKVDNFYKNSMSQDCLARYMNHSEAINTDHKKRLFNKPIERVDLFEKEHSNLISDRRKRIRVFIDPLTEIPKLECWFQIDSHPSSQAVERLTDELNRSTYRQRFPPLQPKNIHLWFKNHRAKVKRQNHEGRVQTGSEILEVLHGEVYDENISDNDENEFQNYK